MTTPVSNEWLAKVATKVETFTVMPTYNIFLGRDRLLSITPERGNQYISILSMKDVSTVEDLVCLFNSDYDGELFCERVSEIYKAITGTTLEES